MTDQPPSGRAPRRLTDAIAEQQAPPCEQCQFSRICTVECRSFRDYMQTGRRISPPREMPGLCKLLIDI